jgi:hypothetical protein
MPNRKLEIVQRLLPDISEALREPEDRAMITWWANIRRDGGLRLTNHGYEIMHDVLKLESYVLDLSDGNDTQLSRSRITKKIILDLDRKLTWPYYLDFSARKKRRRIVFFGSREAMMAAMYGDLESWLASISNIK